MKLTDIDLQYNSVDGCITFKTFLTCEKTLLLVPKCVTRLNQILKYDGHVIIQRS